MGKPTGFMEFGRETPHERPAHERVHDYKEIYQPFEPEKTKRQAARCMDCGVPFCHTGCPLGNIIPDWNDLVFRNQWKRASDMLHATNNFPEFTGRICPAPCEEACVLGINEPPVTIEMIEKQIAERAFADGLIESAPPAKRTEKRVAVVGSGPAGLAAAQQLNRAGHEVVVFERDDRIGGLLRYGIPDFKMEKWIIDRRLDLMRAEGIVFKTGCHIGKTHKIDRMGAGAGDGAMLGKGKQFTLDGQTFDAVVLCGGATKARDLPIPGRDLPGVHYAMDFLPQQNKLVAGDDLKAKGIDQILATGKHVIVIGGGDTGSDCIGTSNRHRAESITQFEILPMPPEGRPGSQPWPFWPMKLRTSSSHEEGCQRQWSVMTKKFLGNGRVEKLVTVEVALEAGVNGKGPQFVEVAGSEREWPCDLALLAMGFTGAETDGVIGQLGLEVDGRGNVKSDAKYMTSMSGVFSAGDMRRGQSLVVWAISEGREAARQVDVFLMGRSDLPSKGAMDLPRA